MPDPVKPATPNVTPQGPIQGSNDNPTPPTAYEAVERPGVFARASTYLNEKHPIKTAVGLSAGTTLVVVPAFKAAGRGVKSLFGRFAKGSAQSVARNHAQATVSALSAGRRWRFSFKK